jgi:hypothetical protein
MHKRKNRETIAANYSKAGRLMSCEGPNEQIVQNINSCASSWQACLSHQRYFVRCTKEYVDAMASECIKSPEARDVTLIQLSFAESEIWIALAGDGTTFLEAN